MAEVTSAYISLLPSMANFGKQASRQLDPQMDRAGRQGRGRFGGLKSAIGPAVALLGTAAIGSFLKAPTRRPVWDESVVRRAYASART